ncbi:MAG: S1 RNA-binding domain-containing protein [Polyangiaceae bacterium]|nr:S1 RNA-binding domain-containing protein [Polyangiaceae bacterium]
MSQDDFASLLEASSKGGANRERLRLRQGDVVEGTVIQIAQDSVFLDIGGASDARIERSELELKDGTVRVKLGDRLRATVVDAEGDAPRLSLSLGRGGGQLDATELRNALEAKLPVSARVSRAVKGGLELDIAGVRAFCPASQIELGHTADLESFVGREVEVLVTKVEEGGRNVVVSRRALLETAQKEQAREMAATLAIGADLEGEVTALNKHGAIVNLGGLDGFVHVSELAHRRVGSPEDVVNVGDRVAVRVLAVEESDKGLRVRLSMKARMERAAPPAADEVLTGTVIKHAGGGVIVSTPKGEGLVPLAELGLPPGADFRRAYPAGKTLEVVVVSRGDRLRFSATGVARVEERKNYKEFSAGSGGASGLGSLGDVLRKKLGLPDAPPPAPEPSPPAAPAASPSAPSPSVATAAEPAPPPPPAARPEDVTAPLSSRDGVVRRRRISE